MVFSITACPNKHKPEFVTTRETVPRITQFSEFWYFIIIASPRRDSPNPKISSDTTEYKNHFFFLFIIEFILIVYKNNELSIDCIEKKQNEINS